MSYIQNIFSSRDNNADGNTYVGQTGRLWWNPDYNAFFYSDGNTAGGVAVGTAVGTGVPTGPVNSIQLNAGSGNFVGTSNLVFSSNVLSVVGNVTANAIVSNSTGNIYITGNLLPSAGTYTLGSATQPWQDAFFGPQSITILDTTGNIGNSVVIENIAANITIGTTGFTVNRFGTTDPVFRIEALTGQIFSNAETIIANVNNSTNVTSGSLQTAGGAGIAKSLYVGNNIVATGNITGGNLTVSGAINYTPAYGQFWSNVTQTVVSANTEYRFLFNNSDGNNLVTLGTGVSNSRVIINKTGLYNIQFSAQIDKTGGGDSSAYIWFKKNGTAIPSTSGFFTLDVTIQAVQSWNILANVTAVGDYYELAYAASATNFQFPALAGNVTVGYTDSPSIFVTVTPIGA